MPFRWTLPRHAPRHARARLAVGPVAQPQAGQFDYPATQVGVAGPVTVYCDPSLGTQGEAAAQALLASAQAAYSQCQGWFNVPGAACNAIVAPLSGNNDGSGGAYHYGCDFSSGSDLYLDAAYGQPPLELGLFIAELSECFMGLQNKGWGCGFSNGEALSRLMAEQVSGGPNGALSPFGTGPQWFNGGRPNYVDTTEQTDQDDVATGCGMVYLYWMMSLGHTLAQITQAGGATLAANYQTLTGKSTAWADFSAAVSALPGGVKSDNPWPETPAPPPPPEPVPPPVPAPPGPTPLLAVYDGLVVAVGDPGIRVIVDQGGERLLYQPALGQLHVSRAWKVQRTP